jgi:hypothetical protein
MWCNIWLSLRGRLTITKSILEAILMYLAWVGLYSGKGSRENQGKVLQIHLNMKKGYKGYCFAKWKLLVKPKEDDGWGLKDIHHFGKSLIIGSL